MYNDGVRCALIVRAKLHHAASRQLDFLVPAPVYLLDFELKRYNLYVFA